jgi:hypothetical protein
MSHSERKFKSKGLQSSKKLLKENTLKESIQSAKKERMSKTMKDYYANAQSKRSGNEEIDTESLDKMVNTLFTKFILHYEYDDLFKIKDEFKNINYVPIDSFGKKLDTYFGIYKIKRTENNNLSSNSRDGSYILCHAKIWIMFVKDFMEKNKIIKFSDICSIFKNALSYEVDEQFLFDYFIQIFKEKAEEEMIDLTGEYIPDEFRKLYFDNKELILDTLAKEIESDGEKAKTIDMIKTIENENELVKVEKEEVAVNEEYNENAIKKEAVKEEANKEEKVLINNISSDDNKIAVSSILQELNMEVDSPKKDDETIFLDISMTNKEEDNKAINSEEKPQSEINNFTFQIDDKAAQPSDIPDLTQSSRSEILNIIYNKINNASILDDENSISTEDIPDKPTFYYNNPLSDYLIKTPEVHLQTIEEVQEDILKTIKIKSMKNQYDMIDTIIRDSDFRNSGNFAILEVAESSKHLMNQKFIITPLREKHSFNEKKSVADDLNRIRQCYTDFMYRPFSREICEQIKVDPQPNKRLSFSNL